MGYEPGLSHSTLQQHAKVRSYHRGRQGIRKCSINTLDFMLPILMQEVDELQAQLAPLKEQLASYQDLPPVS